jgi:Fic family protein
MQFDKRVAAASLSAVIFASLERKYEAATEASVDALVHEAEDLLRGANTEAEILKGAEPTRDLRTDVFNQVRTFYVIEKVWRLRPPADGILARLHASIYGLKLDDVALRQTAEVEDYGEEISFSPAEIPGQLSALDSTIRQGDTLVGGQAAEQARFLALLFAAIIRVHPFPDGNGRTARAAVQYLLRRWNRDLIVIPKVRNDPDWRLALSSGTSGEYSELIEFFRSRMGS